MIILCLILFVANSIRIIYSTVEASTLIILGQIKTDYINQMIKIAQTTTLLCYLKAIWNFVELST
jgi:hypothetical protein